MVFVFPTMTRLYRYAEAWRAGEAAPADANVNVLGPEELTGARAPTPARVSPPRTSPSRSTPQRSSPNRNNRPRIPSGEIRPVGRPHGGLGTPLYSHQRPSPTPPSRPVRRNDRYRLTPERPFRSTLPTPSTISRPKQSTDLSGFRDRGAPGGGDKRRLTPFAAKEPLFPPKNPKFSPQRVLKGLDKTAGGRVGKPQLPTPRTKVSGIYDGKKDWSTPKKSPPSRGFTPGSRRPLPETFYDDDDEPVEGGSSKRPTPPPQKPAEKPAKPAEKPGKLSFAEALKQQQNKKPEKEPSRSPDKTKPPSSVPSGATLVKKDGKLVSNGQQVIPPNVKDGEMHTWPDVPVRMGWGLNNDRNLCYRNAPLQALLHTPAFYRYMGSMHKDCHLQDFQCVVCALQNLTYVYWNVEVSEAETKSKRVHSRLRAALGTLNGAMRRVENLPHAIAQQVLREDFEHGSQSDASEFMHYLLEHIFDKASSADDLSFEQVFDLLWEERWHCENCGNSTNSRKGVPYGESPLRAMDLDVAFDIGFTLPEYVRRELVYRLNTHCDICLPLPEMKRFREVVDGPLRDVRRVVTNAPEIFMVRLRIFGLVLDKHQQPTWYRDSRGRRRLRERKVKNTPAYDEILDLSEYTDGEEELKYRLDAVVAHRGPTNEGGHFIAAARDRDDIFISVNDNNSIGSTPQGRGQFQELRDPHSHGSAYDPYVLVYSKIV